jgi:hypothetical protein
MKSTGIVCEKYRKKLFAPPWEKTVALLIRQESSEIAFHPFPQDEYQSSTGMMP